MPKHKLPPFPTDPIEFAAREKERSEYLSGLFHPLYAEALAKPLEWVVPGFLPRAYLCILAADPKEGKTCFATALALAVATGTPFAGMPTNQTAVLWLAQEEGPEERNLILSQSPLADPATPLYTCYEHLPIDTPDGVGALEHWIKETEAGLLIVDPLHGASSGRSLNDGWAARKTLKLLKRLCALHRVSALVLHHAKLPARYSSAKRVAENAQLAAIASMDLVLTHRPLDAQGAQGARGELGARACSSHPGPRTCSSPALSDSSNSSDSENRQSSIVNRQFPARLLSLASRGRGPFANQTVYFLSSGPLDYMRLDNNPLPPPDPVRKSWVQQEILDLLKSGPAKSTEIIDRLNASPSAVKNALTVLRRIGQVVVDRLEDKARVYRLASREGAVEK